MKILRKIAIASFLAFLSYSCDVKKKNTIHEDPPGSRSSSTTDKSISRTSKSLDNDYDGIFDSEEELSDQSPSIVNYVNTYLGNDNESIRVTHFFNNQKQEKSYIEVFSSIDKATISQPKDHPYAKIITNSSIRNNLKKIISDYMKTGGFEEKYFPDYESLFLHQISCRSTNDFFKMKVNRKKMNKNGYKYHRSTFSFSPKIGIDGPQQQGFLNNLIPLQVYSSMNGRIIGNVFQNQSDFIPRDVSFNIKDFSAYENDECLYAKFSDYSKIIRNGLSQKDIQKNLAHIVVSQKYANRLYSFNPSDFENTNDLLSELNIQVDINDGLNSNSLNNFQDGAGKKSWVYLSQKGFETKLPKAGEIFILLQTNTEDLSKRSGFSHVNSFASPNFSVFNVKPGDQFFIEIDYSINHRSLKNKEYRTYAGYDYNCTTRSAPRTARPSCDHKKIIHDQCKVNETSSIPYEEFYRDLNAKDRPANSIYLVIGNQKRKVLPFITMGNTNTYGITVLPGEVSADSSLKIEHKDTISHLSYDRTTTYVPLLDRFSCIYDRTGHKNWSVLKSKTQRLRASKNIKFQSNVFKKGN